MTARIRLPTRLLAKRGGRQVPRAPDGKPSGLVCFYRNLGESVVVILNDCRAKRAIVYLTIAGLYSMIEYTN